MVRIYHIVLISCMSTSLDALDAKKGQALTA